MGRVQSIRPDARMPVTSPALRILVVTDPSTPAPDAAGRHQLDIEPIGMAALSAANPALRRADAVIVEIDPARPVTFALFEAFAREEAGRLPVIAAVRDLTVTATRQVLRAGAVDVLPLPFTAEDLDAALTPARAAVRAAGPAKRGKVVAFLGAIGGSGTTALATQAGIAWAATARVCLIDLDIQFGNAALYLDLRSRLGVADVVDAGARLDSELLRTIAQPHESGLSVIGSPPDLMPLDTLSPDIVEKTLTTAAEAFDIVLLDLPAAWTTWSMRAIELADLTVLVTSLTVPGIHQARRQAEIIDANGLGDRLRVVVNRVVHPMFGKIDLGETQALLGRRIDHAIANDYPTVSTAIDRGKALATVKAKTRVEKDLRAMVTGLAAALAGTVRP